MVQIITLFLIAAIAALLKVENNERDRRAGKTYLTWKVV
jgi:hypothetical protein